MTYKNFINPYSTLGEELNAGYMKFKWVPFIKI